MRVSLNWLREFVDFDLSPEQLADHLTMLGLEIESMERLGKDIKNVRVGQIRSIEPHPNADKLTVCQTDVGDDQPLQIICGANNMKVGDKVPTALDGAVLPGGYEIGRRKMRGVESHGMMCSETELGIGEDAGGLLILPEDVSVGTDVVSLLELDDVVFEIEVTPNRGDWAGVIGVARELSASLGEELELPDIHLITSERQQAQDVSSIIIDDAELCPRYAGRILVEAEVGESPAWMKARLRAAGVRSINNVVDITNYVLIETGHPLHAFDLDTLAEKRVVVRRAEEGESIRTLDGVERKLDRDVLVIADAQKPIALAGIMGGEETEVGETTQNIFLESAVFNPRFIRHGSRSLGLITEASQRFQRGADPEMARYALDSAAALMREYADTDVLEGVLDEYPHPERPKQVTLRYLRTNEMLGDEVPPHRQSKFIQNLGFETIEETSTASTFKVPTWRHDVNEEADLIEEVARLHGYEAIEPEIPKIARREEDLAPQEMRLRRLREFVIGLGYTECITLAFSSPNEVQAAGLNGGAEEMVTLMNPLSEKHSAMRTSLLPGLLRTCAHNLNRGVNDQTLFEMGPVYLPCENHTLPSQHSRLGLLLTGRRRPPHWSEEEAETDFYDVKGHVEVIVEHFGAKPAFRESRQTTFLPGQAAEILAGDTPAGCVGQIAPGVCRDFEIDANAFVAELDLDVLLNIPQAPPQYQPSPPYPPYLRDMAILVPRDLPGGDAIQVIWENGGELLQDVQLFDVYTGDRIPEDKKSLGLNLVFQSHEKTLSSEDTQAIWDRIVHQLQQRLGAALR